MKKNYIRHIQAYGDYFIDFATVGALGKGEKDYGTILSGKGGKQWKRLNL